MTTRAKLPSCMGRPSARCNSFSISIWRLQSACKLLANPMLTRSKFSMGNKKKRGTWQPKQLWRRGIQLLQWAVTLISLHSQLGEVNFIPLKLRLLTSFGLLYGFECHFVSSPSMYVGSFRSPFMLSTESWFYCRSPWRLASSWCRTSFVPFEFRRPSPRTQSPTTVPSPPPQTFPVAYQGLTHICTVRYHTDDCLLLTKGPPWL